jgi:hypothetical protein
MASDTVTDFFVDFTRSTMIYGCDHVQLSGAGDKWRRDPFRATVHDGRGYGPGAADNDGQRLAHLLAIESWIRLHRSRPCRIEPHRSLSAPKGAAAFLADLSTVVAR